MNIIVIFIDLYIENKTVYISYVYDVYSHPYTVSVIYLMLSFIGISSQNDVIFLDMSEKWRITATFCIN